ncbi:hypothetical protein As57867_005923, partial [Aphanomyces stellatus]
MDETWDVVRDLHFLFATDDQLHDELAYVCDLLSGSMDTTSTVHPPMDKRIGEDGNDTGTSSSTTSSALLKRTRDEPLVPSATATTQSGGTRQQRQLRALRQQVALMKDQLIEARRNAGNPADMSAWERAARDQLYAKTKTLQENEELRAAVHDQATMIDNMTRLLRKKPRLTMDIHSEAWRTYKLAAQASLRVAAIHAIADRQYSLQQTEFIKAGLYNRTDDVLRSDPMQGPDGKAMVERVYHVKLAAPFRRVGSASWTVFNGKYQSPLPDGGVESFEALDDRTIYRALTTTRGAVSAHSNFVFKYYVEPEREVFV